MKDSKLGTPQEDTATSKTGRLNLINLPAFLLMLAGAMAFGSLYSALINRVGVPLTAVGIVMTGLMLFFIYAGYYAYQLLTFGRGNRVLALIFVSLVALLSTLSLLQGYGPMQIWFAFHEILNLASSWVLVILLAVGLLKKK